LHDENLLEYLKLTAPFGSGDENVDAQGKQSPSPRPQRASSPTKEGAQRLASAIARGWGPNAAKMKDLGTRDVAIDTNLNPKHARKLRVLLADMEKGRDGK
jgi:hypothetical protein